MKYTQFKFSAPVWLYPGKVAWHFVTIPPSISVDIDSGFKDLKRGWGSLPIAVTIGATTWQTSIFPDKKLGAYLLPIKSEVRKKENIFHGMVLSVLIEILI